MYPFDSFRGILQPGMIFGSTCVKSKNSFTVNQKLHSHSSNNHRNWEKRRRINSAIIKKTEIGTDLILIFKTRNMSR